MLGVRSPLLAVAVILLLLAPAAAGAQGIFASADISALLRTSYDDDLLIQVANDGPSDATGVAVVTLPPGLLAVDLPAGCVAEGATTLRCTTPELMPGSRTTFPVEIVQTDRGAQQVTASVQGSTSDPRSGNDRATISIDTLPAPVVGNDPVEAAVVVSRMRFRGAAARVPHVVLARSDDVADALAGSALTGNAPLLYTAPSALAPATAEEIDRVLPDGGTVLVLGGPGAIAEPVVEALRTHGHHPVRLAGVSRIGTALAVADRLVDAGADPSTVVVARAFGEGAAAWADAVAFGAYAASTATPVLLADGDVGSREVAAWMAEHATARTIVAGGPAAVSNAALAGLPGVQRVAGSDRAGTAVAAARLLHAQRPAGEGRDGDAAFHLVNGYLDGAWTHGLLAAGLAADEHAPLLYVDTHAAPEATAAALTSCRDSPVAIAVVGGPEVVDPSVRAHLDELDADAC